MNLGNVQGTFFFVVSTGADYNRLQNYKIAVVRGGGEDGDGMGGRGRGGGVAVKF